MRKETVAILREMKRSEELAALRDQALEEWKNVTTTRIVRAQDMKAEDLGVYALEMKYGVKAISWLFNSYIDNKIALKKVDKKKE